MTPTPGPNAAGWRAEAARHHAVIREDAAGVSRLRHVERVAPAICDDWDALAERAGKNHTARDADLPCLCGGRMVMHYLAGNPYVAQCPDCGREPVDVLLVKVQPDYAGDGPALYLDTDHWPDCGPLVDPALHYADARPVGYASEDPDGGYTFKWTPLRNPRPDTLAAQLDDLRAALHDLGQLLLAPVDALASVADGRRDSGTAVAAYRQAVERLGDNLPPSHRGGVTLSDECWDWLGATAARDGTTRDDLLDGLVLLAMDADKP